MYIVIYIYIYKYYICTVDVGSLFLPSLHRSSLQVIFAPAGTRNPVRNMQPTMSGSIPDGLSTQSGCYIYRYPLVMTSGWWFGTFFYVSICWK